MTWSHNRRTDRKSYYLHCSTCKLTSFRYGIGITGKAFSESTLIRIASVHERLSPVREQAEHYKLPTINLEGRELKGSL